MKTKVELEELNDEQEMLKFFIEHHKSGVEMTKMRVLHAFHNLLDGIEKVYEELTNGMTKEQIAEWQESMENEESEDSEWNESFNLVISKIEEKHHYKLDIEVDEFCVSINYYTKFFWIRYNGNLHSGKLKLSEMEKDFEIELTDDAHFLIDLMTALVYEHQEE